jgi:dihydrodipicolinate synthase/N-acetylneuraminate lyase
LLVGDDHLLLAGLRAGWNGGISGVAGFCPELLVALHRSATVGDMEQAARYQRVLDEVIEQIAPFPTPWGIRIGLSARGIDTGPLPLPLSARRQAQARAFREWCGKTEIPHPSSLIPDPESRIGRRFEATGIRDSNQGFR